MVKTAHKPVVKFYENMGEILRGRSIGHRISMLVATTTFTAVLLVTAILAYTNVTGDFAARKTALEATGYVFASALADHLGDSDNQESLKILRSINRIPEVTYAAVIGSDGSVFAALGSTIMLDAGALKSDQSLMTTLRTGSYPVAVDIVKSGRSAGRVLLIADISDLGTELLQAFLTSLAVACLAIAASFVVARHLQRRVTAPILALTGAMQDIRETKTYDRHVVRESDDETGMLVDSFNAMITEIRARDVALVAHRQNLETTVELRTHELRQARDLAESANQAKSSFLATMSHEIRTPLNGLMVMAELLAGAGLDQRLQRYAEVIVKSGRSLLTIINDILDLSKIEAGKLELECVPLNPAGIADDVASLFWEKASSKGLDLAARVAPNVPHTIHGDPVRLNQILSNLVNNALKFTDSGQVLISLQYDAGLLTLAVSDSGIGIPLKTTRQLFQAFSQADQTITRKFGGTGLGLAICKRLAEAMGGTIGVRSKLGEGSTFWVRIPATAISAGPSQTTAPANKRAAMAVSGLASQSALGTALVAAGFKVSVIETGTTGFDVVFASASRLAYLRHGPGNRPPIICLGQMGDSSAETAISEKMADDLMILPIRQQDVAEMIVRINTDALRGRRVLERHAPTMQPATSFAGRHVLVADDNAVNREVIIEALRQFGITVQVAVNGIEAVESWRTRKPDLIFMDCSMPEMDGYSATREIRAHEAIAIAGGHTPIIALTAHVAGTDGETWRDAGMDAYMTKPFTLSQIAACLEAQFEGLPMIVDEAAVPPRPSAEILDESVLDELRKIGGSDALFRRVLDLFASRVPQAVEMINALAEGDLKELADAAHALKSMCSNIGANHAVEACHELELVARTGGEFDAGAMIGTIITEVKNVMSEVDRLRSA